MVRYRFGETEDIRATVAERDDEACVLASATVSIASEEGTELRTDVVCSVDDTVNPKELWYHETFSAANGYAEDGIYTATFKAVIAWTGTSYAVKAIVMLMVDAVKDE